MNWRQALCCQWNVMMVSVRLLILVVFAGGAQVTRLLTAILYPCLSLLLFHEQIHHEDLLFMDL